MRTSALPGMTGHDRTRRQLLHTPVLDQAALTPTAPAVRQWDDRLTYGELTDRAAGLAEQLRRLGAGPEIRVGVCGHRTPALLTAVLAVLLSGGAYVPLDPAHPRRRLAEVVADADITVALVDEAGDARLDGLVSHRVRLDGPGGPAAARPSGDGGAHPVSAALRETNAAYVLYTSGSTGRPKGVVVTHRNAAGFVAMAGGRFGDGPAGRAVAFSSFGFDVSVLDVFVPLARGGCVQLVPDRDRTDPGRLQAFLEAHEVTWGAIAPPLLPLLDPDRLPALADVITAGEPPDPEQVARWTRRHGRRFHNWYGPTETTVCVTGAELSGEWHSPLPIGMPLPGTTTHVLGEDLRPSPPGVPGELCIGGPQVTRGYLGRPGLTAERFVPDPFGSRPGERLYRTGDRVLLDERGQLLYLGRGDRQVKIRGQRVELGEVESVVRAHPQVGQVVADVRDDNLTVYVTPLDAPGFEETVRHCAGRLPSYMIPTRVVLLATLPLTAAGKTDMAALRRIERVRSSGGRPPYTPDERAVAGVWAGLFGDPEPALDDDFLEQGGTSLLAMRLVSTLRHELGRDVSVADVFTARTLERLAARVATCPPLAHRALPSGSHPGLTSLQRRMWFVERLAGGAPVHTISLAYRCTGPADLDALRRALRAVVERHEVLRWRVQDDDGIPYATVLSPPEAEQLLPEPGESTGEDVLAAVLEQEAGTPFDLAAGPLWRSRLLRLGPEDHVLALSFHHAVFDGWSQEVLLDELGAHYAAERQVPGARRPAVGTTTFADYAAWLRERRAERSAADTAWWREHLAGAPTVLDLPRDHVRPPVQTFRGAQAHSDAGEKTARRVQELAERLGTTPGAVLLAAFGLLLRRLTGERDLVIGAPFADRRHTAFESLVGPCVEILPLRLVVDDEADFTEHVRRAHAELAAARDHMDTSLEQIVRAMGLGRDPARGALVQVLFNLHDFHGVPLHLDGLATRPLPAGLPGALFDLTLYAEQGHDRLKLRTVYNPDLFSGKRTEAFLAGYTTLLADLLAAPERRVGAASASRAVATSRPRGATVPCAPGGRPAQGVVERIEQRTAEAPDEIAVQGSGGQLTRAELSALARQATRGLGWAGIGPGDSVAVLAGHDVRFPALLLGVLAAGARWAVLDAAHPPSHLLRQARAARARALLVTPGARSADELSGLPTIDLADADGDPPRGHDPAQRGYLSFTSGTSGVPKTVVAAEGPLAYFLTWYPDVLGLGQDDRFALLSGLGHDPALRDIFTPLTLGARLFVPDRGLLRDPESLTEWLDTHGVTVLHLTPQHGRLLASAGRARLPKVRLVVLAGDRLTRGDVTRLRRLAPGARLVNGYGTTETPQLQSFHVVTDADAHGPDSVPVGHGAAGTQLLVLSALGRPAAVGELGEVAVLGSHLATEYLGADPIGTDAAGGLGDTSERLFRTGDLGRHRPDGAVVIAGRRDDQVKIRGFRVEPDEVRAMLTTLADVADAEVLADAEQRETILVAYVVPAHPGVSAESLRAQLTSKLPDYAIPAQIRLIDALPLTPNGKPDRHALRSASPVDPAPALADGEIHGTAAQLVAEVWRGVLGRVTIGPDTNFFDIGGHSLAILQVQERLSARLGRRIPVVDLFRHPTVRALAAHLQDAGADPGLDQAERRIRARRRGRLAGTRMSDWPRPHGRKRSEGDSR